MLTSVETSASGGGAASTRRPRAPTSLGSTPRSTSPLGAAVGRPGGGAPAASHTASQRGRSHMRCHKVSCALRCVHPSPSSTWPPPRGQRLQAAPCEGRLQFPEPHHPRTHAAWHHGPPTRPCMCPRDAARARATARDAMHRAGSATPAPARRLAVTRDGCRPPRPIGDVVTLDAQHGARHRNRRNARRWPGGR